MKKELRVLLTAVMFYTRLPCPGWVDHSAEYLQKSIRYLSLVGILVGSIGAVVFLLASFLFPRTIALLLSMIATVLVTGAFHEDGLSDMCDGFGGGWSKEGILRIMKDSRTGTFGVVGLLFILLLKYAALYQIAPAFIPLVLVAGHAISRFAAVTLFFTHDYVREETDSKVKSAAQRISTANLFVSGIFGLLPLLFFFHLAVFCVLIPVFAARWYLGRVFMKRIGGQTGDCAGATQQICEVVFYLSLLVLWKFI